ncbi:MAG: DUF2141 domain-containing protein [Caulobacteraceae bacterium]
MIPAKTGALALTIAVACALAAGAGRGQECEGTPGPARLIIHVDAVQSDRGLMTASLYPGDRSQFLIRNGALKVWSVPARAPSTRMCIWLTAPGTYAVAIYHDANSNHRLDRNALGMPSEAFGFSNNPRILFSPPSFQAVAFQAAAGDTELHIRLRYP